MSHFNNKTLGTAICRGIDVLIAQRVKGQQKYGVTIEDANLTADQLAEHAQQEAADGLVYATQLREAIKRDIAQAQEELAAEFRDILTDTLRAPELRLAMALDLAERMSSARRCITLYAQQSQLQLWIETEPNLLTLSRSNSFPFQVPMKVIG